MRDHLYRICEAYYGRALTGPTVASQLSQTQDLTLALLAIEQLTGPVAAQQVTLGDDAAVAAASSSLVSIQNLLDSARENEKSKQTALTAAQDDLGKKEKALTSAKTDYDKAKAELDKATGTTSEIEALRAKANNLKDAVA